MSDHFGTLCIKGLKPLLAENSYEYGIFLVKKSSLVILGTTAGYFSLGLPTGFLFEASSLLSRTWLYIEVSTSKSITLITESYK